MRLLAVVLASGLTARAQSDADRGVNQPPGTGHILL